MRIFRRPDNSVLPTTIFGYFLNGAVRFESPQGGEWYNREYSYDFYFMSKPHQCATDFKWWALTHNQRRIRFMILIQKPLCFHLLWIFRQQEPGIPGSEKALTFRIGLWRWDVVGTKGLNWIGPFTWYLGLHFD